MKSADAVAAVAASGESRAWYTAPLCLMKVPIQSPVIPSRSMGLLSTAHQQVAEQEFNFHTLASRYQIVLAILSNVGEVEMRNRA